jgi:hypothetical protein
MAKNSFFFFNVKQNQPHLVNDRKWNSSSITCFEGEVITHQSWRNGLVEEYMEKVEAWENHLWFLKLVQTGSYIN